MHVLTLKIFAHAHFCGIVVGSVHAFVPQHLPNKGQQTITREFRELAHEHKLVAKQLGKRKFYPL